MNVQATYAMAARVNSSDSRRNLRIAPSGSKATFALPKSCLTMPSPSTWGLIGLRCR